VRISREQLKVEGFLKPVPLSYEMIRSFSEYEKSLLIGLTGSIQHEEKLRGSVNSISGFISTSQKEMTQLGEVRKTVVAGINEALDCGLGSLEIIQQHCNDFGVKP